MTDSLDAKALEAAAEALHCMYYGDDDPPFHAMATKVVTAYLDAARPSSIETEPGAFQHGDRVRKIRGSSWQGIVVGKYSTALTPDGYCVESKREPGSVQIYPAAALELVATVASPPNTDGWQTVPVEPTKAMRRAIANADWKGRTDLSWADGWRIMLAAAPTEKQEGDGA